MTHGVLPAGSGLSLQRVELTAERFVPDFRPPDFPIELRGLPTYRFKVKESPKETKYQLWMKNLGRDPQLLAADSEFYVVDEQSQLLMICVDDKETRVQFS